MGRSRSVGGGHGFRGELRHWLRRSGHANYKHLLLGWSLPYSSGTNGGGIGQGSLAAAGKKVGLAGREALREWSSLCAGLLR
jgi:hypothetical protein